MNKKIIIRLYDEEQYPCPLLEVEEQDFDEIKKVLEEYRTEDEYNIDEFILLLTKKELLIRTINADQELRF